MSKPTERQLEEAICTDPTILFPSSDAEVVARQLVLPHGILDLLISLDSYALVTELKARELKEGDIGQVLRYFFDVRWAITNFVEAELSDLVSAPKLLTQSMFADSFSSLVGAFRNCNNGDIGIVPVLIGNSISKKVLASAMGAGIWVYTWKFKGGKFSFEQKRIHPLDQVQNDSCVEEITAKMALATERRIEEIFDCLVNIFFEQCFDKAKGKEHDRTIKPNT